MFKINCRSPFFFQTVIVSPRYCGSYYSVAVYTNTDNFQIKFELLHHRDGWPWSLPSSSADVAAAGEL